MKKLVSAVLITAAVAQPALARSPRDAANRKDVAQAQSDADNMSSAEAGLLRMKVLFAEIILGELHFNQGLMDRFSADHSRNVKTFALGALRAGLPLAAGVWTLKNITKEERVAWGTEMKQRYEVIAEKRQAVRAARAAAVKDLGKVDKTVLDARVAEATGGLRAEVATLVKEAEAVEAARPLWVRAQKPLRVYLGPVVGAALVIDGAAAVGQFIVDPAYADDIEARLTRFVDDANDTLARR